MYQNFMEQLKHAQANEYKDLCAISNDMVKKKNGTPLDNGWIKLDSYHNPKTNFKGVLYEKNGQYVMCFVGTDRWSGKDHGANIKMGLTGKSGQIDDAIKFYEQMQDKHPINPFNTISAGHSEGGTEATYVGIKNGIKTFTYNAFGISKKHLEKGRNYDDLITNYRDGQDPVSKLKSNVGKTYITESTQNLFMSSTPFGSIQSHGIKNMGDCNKAVPIEDYKKNHRLFLDKLSEAVITREDIAAMPQDLYKVYEKELDTRMANNEIHGKGDANYRVAMGNLVYVNGYTRDDGTEVSGYYRRLPMS